MALRFGLRLLSVSFLNYLFGNLLFAFLWNVSTGNFAYWKIAIISTFLASVFSYQTQSRYILKIPAETLVNLRYVAFQLLGLAFAILAVPSISRSWQLNIVIVQFGWSAFFSLVSLFLLRRRNFFAKTISE